LADVITWGRLAAAVWSSPDKVPFIALALNTVMKETNSPQPPPGSPGPFSLSDEGILKDSFIRSGFTDIIIDRINVVFNFNSAEDYTSFVYGHAAPIRATLANETPERKEDVLNPERNQYCFIGNLVLRGLSSCDKRRLYILCEEILYSISNVHGTIDIRYRIILGYVCWDGVIHP
jgi:hypothetical protein